jgi:transposase
MEWSVCVGIDWADRKHAYALRSRTGAEEEGEFDSSPASVHGWVQELRRKHPEGDIVIALEQSRGSLMYALSAYDFLRLVPINPRAASAYRESLYLSGAKDDPVDAVLLRDFASTHLGQLRVWRADDERTRRLRLLVEGRRSMVDQRTALVLELDAVLKQYFPHVLGWCGSGLSSLTRAFLRRWPTLEKARAARSDALCRLIKEHSRKSAERQHELVAAIRRAVALTDDRAIVDALSLRTEVLIGLIDALELGVARYDEAIAATWQEHEDRPIFESFPGAGPVIAPRLTAAFGSDRERFSTAAEVQTLSGIAPVIARSGKRSWTHARWRCPKFLRQTFHEFAEASIPHCTWARAFYRQQRARGAGHHAAIRALAFRWIRVLFRAWQSRTPYDDATFVATLRRRGSGLAALIAA